MTLWIFLNMGAAYLIPKARPIEAMAFAISPFGWVWGGTWTFIFFTTGGGALYPVRVGADGAGAVFIYI